jgi:hypothetical protein
LAAGMLDNLWRVRSASVAVASATGAQFRIESEPPDHSSPLYGITKWGGNIVRTLAEGMTRELGLLGVASGGLASVLVPLSAGGPTATGGGTVHETHIHLTYSGKMPSDENDLVALLEQLSPFIDGRLRTDN